MAYLVRQLIKFHGNVVDGAICGLDLGVSAHLDEPSLYAGWVFHHYDFRSVFNSAHVQILSVFSLFPFEYHSLLTHF